MLLLPLMIKICSSNVHGFEIPISAIDVSMKDTLVAILVDYHCIVKCSAIMDQFRQGLNLFDVLTMVQKYPQLMKQFFVNENSPMTAGNQTYFHMNVFGLLLSSYRCINGVIWT